MYDLLVGWILVSSIAQVAIPEGEASLSLWSVVRLAKRFVQSKFSIIIVGILFYTEYLFYYVLFCQCAKCILLDLKLEAFKMASKVRTTWDVYTNLRSTTSIRLSALLLTPQISIVCTTRYQGRSHC